MPIGHTSRGFADYADFIDTYGAHVTMRESSADPLDKLWIFVKGGELGLHVPIPDDLKDAHPVDVGSGGGHTWPNPRYLYMDRSGQPVARHLRDADGDPALTKIRQDGSMHINVEQAKLLIAGLQEWVRKQEEMGPPQEEDPPKKKRKRA